ncbi:MAG: 2-hydroxychromene-2-carboxylate isomerase [Hyphomicrobiaceae bacterium]
MTRIDYYLSVNSPWTYLGSARLLEQVATHGVAVRAKPTRFADVFAETGGLPLPKRSPERQAYRLMDLKRWRSELGIALVLEPVNFPSDEMPGYRLIIAAQIAGLDAVRLSAEIGRSLWEKDRNIGDPEVLRAAALRAGMDADSIRAAGPDDDELDAIVAANAKEAVTRGVFGAPSYVFEDGEIMWGQDRLAFVDKKLSRLSGGATSD